MFRYISSKIEESIRNQLTEVPSEKILSNTLFLALGSFVAVRLTAAFNAFASIHCSKLNGNV